MTNQKGKMFRFEESDLEWINPLLLEGTEENEGKKKSDLITELLTDYKHQRDTLALGEERALKFKTYVDKVKAPIDTGFSALNRSLTKTTTGIDKFLARSSEKIKGIVKRSESEE